MDGPAASESGNSMRAHTKQVHASLQSVLLYVTGASILTLLSAPAQGPIVLKNEDVTFKFGVQGRICAGWTLDSTGGHAASTGLLPAGNDGRDTDVNGRAVMQRNPNDNLPPSGEASTSGA